MIHEASQVAGDAKAELMLGADKAYEAQKFINACTKINATPHVARI